MGETIAVREGEDFDATVAERYLRERLDGLPEGEIEVRQFPSGASNLTYLLKIEDWEGVLRRLLLAPVPAVTATPGLMTREEIIDRYAEKSGRDLAEMHWYVVCGYFKLTGILQQIFARWKNGQTRGERFITFGDRVRTLILHAEHLSRTGDV